MKKVVDVAPEVIIHTAAYTDVDGCEENKYITSRKAIKTRITLPLVNTLVINEKTILTKVATCNSRESILLIFSHSFPTLSSLEHLEEANEINDEETLKKHPAIRWEQYSRIFELQDSQNTL